MSLQHDHRERWPRPTGPAPEAALTSPSTTSTASGERHAAGPAVRTGHMSTGRAGEPQAPERAAERAGEDPVADCAWERPRPRIPVFRWRSAGSAVLILVVAVAAWWTVTWLLRPADPEPLSVDGPVSAASDGASAVKAPHPAASSPGTQGSAAPAGASGTAAEDEEPETARLRVHVIGHVRSPGVVSLPPQSRTTDAIAAAGGHTGAAQLDRINLAAPVSDGQQLLVPGPDTTEEQLQAAQSPGGTAENGAGLAEPGGPAAAPAAVDADTVQSGVAADAVDLNTADSTLLQTLPGVGPATAAKILAQREQVGPFQSLTDLDAVPGIGPATLERLAPLVTW